MSTFHGQKPEKLHVIRFAMNTSWCETIRHSSAVLMFEGELQSPDKVRHHLRQIVQITENFKPEIAPYLDRLAITLKEAWDIHNEEQLRRKRYNDEKRILPGDKVITKLHIKSNSDKKKYYRNLQASWRFTYTIGSVPFANSYSIPSLN